MNSARAASTPSLDAFTMCPLVSRSMTRIRGSEAAAARSSSRTASSLEQSSTRISSQSSQVCASTESIVAVRMSSGVS